MRWIFHKYTEMTIAVGGTDLGGVSNVLLLEPGGREWDGGACAELLASGGGTTRVLAVTYTDPSIAHLDEFESVAGHRPAEVSIVSVDETATEPRTETVDGMTIRSVGPADNLTGVAAAVSECLGAWSERAAPDDDLVFCFDSLTAMLQSVSRERAFRFLHVLTRRLEQAGAVGHYHVEPGRHDEQTIATLSPLFDATIEVTADDDVEVWS